MKEVDPTATTRAAAFELWMNAPMPMVTFFKTIDITRLLKAGARKKLKFNMLMCWCVGRAAREIQEFYMLPVDGRLILYDRLAVNTIVLNESGEVSSCDIPFDEDLREFNRRYLELTEKVAQSCLNHDENDCMVIGTSNISGYDIDGAVGMYSGIFNNPFLIWGRYRRRLLSSYLKVSFQFHHTQMDGAHAARFLHLLQEKANSCQAD